DILVGGGDEVGERPAAVIHRGRGRRSHRGPFGGERQQFAARSAKKRARTIGMTLAAEVPQVITANLAGFHSGGDGMSQRATRHRVPPSLTTSRLEMVGQIPAAGGAVGQGDTSSGQGLPMAPGPGSASRSALDDVDRQAAAGGLLALVL